MLEWWDLMDVKSPAEIVSISSPVRGEEKEMKLMYVEKSKLIERKHVDENINTRK